MSPEMVARLILEWWTVGELTSERLEALTAHFVTVYNLDAQGRAFVGAYVERMARV